MTDTSLAVIECAEVIIIAAQRYENTCTSTAHIRSAGIVVITFQIIDATARESGMVALAVKTRI
jgi:hypothetical protein